MTSAAAVSSSAPGGMAWAPRNVALTSSGWVAPSRCRVRSIFISVSVSSPYPDLASTVVVPAAIMASMRSRSRARSSSSSLERVDLTVKWMPPPALWISR